MKTKGSNILVSGASVSGLTLAYWLMHYGFNVMETRTAARS